MRDPARIHPLLGRLAAAWSRCPDMRLGQLVACAAARLRGGSCDPFYIEDAALVAEIEMVADEQEAL